MPDAAAAVLSDAKADALIHLAAIAVPFSAPEDVIMRTNAGLAISVLQRRRARRHPEDRGGVAARPCSATAARRAGARPAAAGRGDPDPAVERVRAVEAAHRGRPCGMLQRQTGDATRFAAFRPCYVIAPEEWAGAPTQQGHTVRERLDDPALSAPALFNYVDARDVAGFAGHAAGAA